MKRQYFLEEVGNFYKANLHSHSTYSDGELTPEEVKKLYKNHGYSIFAYTDHNIYKYHKDLTDNDFLVLGGFESDFTEGKGKEWPNKKTFHINFVDTNPEKSFLEKQELALNRPNTYDVSIINDYIKSLVDLGCLATYNHPFWSLQDYRDYSQLKNLFAMEIGNYGCEVDGNFGFAPQVYDEMLRSGQNIFCISTDDNHNRQPKDSPYHDSFGGYIMISSEKLTYGSIINSLKNGNFYSGREDGAPELKEIYHEGNEIVVKTSNAKRIYLVNKTRDCHYKLAEKDKYINEARFTLRGNEEWFRIDVEDEYGRHAYSNAYPIADNFNKK